MLRKGRRIIAGIAWVVGSLIAWAVVCNVFAFSFIYLANERQVKFPEWTSDVYNWTAIGGIVLIPAVVAVLAIHAYLPGTGTRPSKSRGTMANAVVWLVLWRKSRSARTTPPAA